MSQKIPFRLTFHGYRGLRAKTLPEAVYRHCSKYLRNSQDETYSGSTEVYNFLNLKKQKHFQQHDIFQVELIDYEEQRGSFIVQFSLLLIGTIHNYKLLNDSLMNFRSDIRLFFEDHFSLEIVYEHPVVELSNEHSPLQKKTESLWKKRARVISTTTVAILLSAAGIFDDQLFKDRGSKYETHPLQNELFIEHQINEAQRIDIYKEFEYYLNKERIDALVDEDTLHKAFVDEVIAHFEAIKKRYK